MHLVVANELHSRKDQVWLVSQQAQQQRRQQQQQQRGDGSMDVQHIVRPPGCAVIETPLVQEVVASHQRHRQSGNDLNTAVPVK